MPLFDKVRRVLIYSWNPVAVDDPSLLPVDEYDSYVPYFIGLVREHAPIREIVKVLANLELKYFSEIATSESAKVTTAKKLVALGLQLGDDDGA